MRYRLFLYLIAGVWLVNGLFCKVLGLAPRHEQIVGRILGHTYEHELTVAIGWSEVLMAVWVVSRIAPAWCFAAQIALVLIMNAIEFSYAPDLLLFGKLNALNALLFAGLLYYTGFVLAKPINQRT